MAAAKSDSNGFDEFKQVILFRLDQHEKKIENISVLGDKRKDAFFEKLDEVKNELRESLGKAKSEIIAKVNQLELKYTSIDTKMKFTLGLYAAIGSAFFSIIINIVIQSFSS